MRPQRLHSAQMLLVLLLLLPASRSLGQAASLDYNLSTPSLNSTVVESSSSFVQNHYLAWSFSLYSPGRTLLGQVFRTSVFVRRETVKIQPRELGTYSSIYFNKSLGLGADVLLLRRGPVELSAGISACVNHVTQNNRTPLDCDSLFCSGNEKSEWSWLVAPSVTVGVTPKAGYLLYLRARASRYTDDAHELFPFKAGAVIAVGLELRSSW